MSLGHSVHAPVTVHDSRRRVRPIKVSKDIRPESPSTERLGRRELRYVRDREGLRASLSRCTEEPCLEQLQIRALERVKYELEDRIRDYETRIGELRNRLAGQPGLDSNSRESLHRQRLIVEHGLALSREELTVISEELGRLNIDVHSSRAGSVERPSSCSSSASRPKANLSLFFQNSPTRRPLPKSTRPYSADYIRRANISHRRKFDQGATHLRSKSLMEDYATDELHVDGDQRARPTSSAPCIIPASSSRWADSRSTRLVPAVDEFNNSFSSRVIAPPSQPRPRSSLRNLQMTSGERERMFVGRSRRSSVDRSEYGNVTLLPRVVPRSSVDLLDDLPNVPLPSYVHNLMSEFEQASQPSLTFNLMEDEIPDAPVQREAVPLSPVLEQASPIPSVKSHLTTKPTGRKLMKKQRPIFTLRLPTRPPAPGASLAASSSTSFDASSDEHPLPIPIVESTVALRPKGLPSTRDHDLAMLDVAPDEIPESPLRHEPTLPTSMKRASRSFAMLRRVKSRLVQLGRF